MTRRIEFTVPDEVGELYDRARGDVPMAAWIKRALEDFLGDGAVAKAVWKHKEIPEIPEIVLRASRHAPSAPGNLPRSALPADHRALALERQAKLNKAKS